MPVPQRPTNPYRSSSETVAKFASSRRDLKPKAARELAAALTDPDNQQDAMALFLMHERALGGNSSWGPYIAVLPQAVGPASSWSAEELALLQDEEARGSALQAKAEILEAYNRSLPLLRRVFGDVGVPAADAAYASPRWGVTPDEAAGMLDSGKADAACRLSAATANASGQLPPYTHGQLLAIDFTFGCRPRGIPGFGLSHASLQSFAWARSIVASRALHLRGKRYLVPLADMFNYSPQPGTSMRRHGNGAHFLKYHVVSEAYFRVIADRSAAAGNQLWEDYGDDSNDVFLAYHGFVSPENPFDCVRLALPPLRGRASAVASALGLRAARLNGSACLRSPAVSPPLCDARSQPDGGDSDGDQGTSHSRGGCIDARHRWWIALGAMNGSELAACAEAVKSGKGEVTAILRAGKGVLRNLPPAVSAACPGLFVPSAAPAGPSGPGAASSASGAHSRLASSKDDRLAKHFARALGRYPTSLSDDDRLSAAYDAEHSPMAHGGSGGLHARVADPIVTAAARGLTPAGRTALLYRIGRKKILAALVQHFQEAEGSSGSNADSSDARPSSAATAASKHAARAPAVGAAKRAHGSAPGLQQVGRALLPARDAAAYFTNAQAAAAADACEAFNAWFLAQGPSPSHVRCAPVAGGMRLGVVTTSDVPAESVYLGVPTSAIMSGDSARADPVSGPVLRDLATALDAPSRVLDDVNELLLHLLIERFVKGKSSNCGMQQREGGDDRPLASAVSRPSHWAPYLALLPSPDEMVQPLFWSPDELAALAGSAVANDIAYYREAVEARWSVWNATLLPALTVRFPEVFLAEVAFEGCSSPASNDAATADASSLAAAHSPVHSGIITKDRFLWAHAVLDSRSIWWDGARHLVPMLDLVNTAEGPDTARLHSTALDTDTRSFALTRADRHYSAGDQLFEAYGQPNHIYLSYHGFSYPGNSHDCARVDIPVPPDSVVARMQTAGADKGRNNAEERRRAGYLHAHLEEDRLRQGSVDPDGSVRYPILNRACLVPGGLPFTAASNGSIDEADLQRLLRPSSAWPIGNAIALQVMKLAHRISALEALRRLQAAATASLVAYPSSAADDLALLARDAAAQVALETADEEAVDEGFGAFVAELRRMGMTVAAEDADWRLVLGEQSHTGTRGGRGSQRDAAPLSPAEAFKLYLDRARTALLAPRVREAVRFRLTQKVLLAALSPLPAETQLTPPIDGEGTEIGVTGTAVDHEVETRR